MVNEALLYVVLGLLTVVCAAWAGARLDVWAARHAYDKGREAHKAGNGQKTCPFMSPMLREAWLWGWRYQSADTQATDATDELARLRKGVA